MRQIKQSSFTFSFYLILGLLSLSACSSKAGDSLDVSGGARDMYDAATAPLEDLNLKRKDIPLILVKTAENPYATPEKFACIPLRQEIEELDALLGPDYSIKEYEVASNDAQFLGPVRNVELPSTDQAINGGGHLIHDALVGTIRSQSNFLPFRSVLRRLTGAERHRKKIEQAFQAGHIRRAYLKGLIEVKYGKKCYQQALPPKAKDADSTSVKEEESPKTSS